jgi:hypothetical protein
MRRPLIISLFAAASAIAAVALSATASTASTASTATPAIICPLASPPIGTCCGPPISTPVAAPAATPCCPPSAGGTLCCPGNAVCLVPMTINTTPNPSVAGSAVTISGQVQGATAGSAVALWEEPAGQTSFHQVAHATTDSAGKYSVRRRASSVMTNRDWYVASGGSKSTTVAQIVEAKVAMSATAHKLASGHRITVSGRIDPSHAGQRVLYEQSIKGKWHVLARVRLNRKSRYAIARHWAHGGIVKLRVVLPADRQNAQSISPVITVTLNG